MATIKPIEDRTVHQIQSGQVIVDICSVVKELVENSLDAGASSIDIRFKRQGLDSIEVQDNGNGVSHDNYETLALKHYTSKLSTYSDLTTLQTFGFRGEALSSLCALSRLSVTTCMAVDAPKGTKLEFEASGRLKGTSVTAAQRGTIVVVEDLFSNLPVRRRELEQNIKREWGRVVGVLNQYACIQTGIKFSVTQQPLKGKKTILFSTRGNLSTKENIVNVFGVKTLAALTPLDLTLKMEQSNAPRQLWSGDEFTGNKQISIKGHISRPAVGEGRQLPDRQMFFVNARPCGLPQVAKIFNEVYRAYNSSQSPFIFANIELDTHLYDVNVSPDKRTILLHDQARMLGNLKAALVELFEAQDYTVPISQVDAQKQKFFKQSTINLSDGNPGNKKPPILATGEASVGDNPDSMSTDESEEESQLANTPKVNEPSSRRRHKGDGKLTRGVLGSMSPDGGVHSPHDSQVSDTGIVRLENFVPNSVKSNTDTVIISSQKELTIPALPSTLQSHKASAFSSSLASRPTPPAIATITIGTHTTTSAIGTPSLKQSIYNDTSKGPQSTTSRHVPKTSISSFGSRLTKRFVAHEVADASIINAKEESSSQHRHSLSPSSDEEEDFADEASAAKGSESDKYSPIVSTSEGKAESATSDLAVAGDGEFLEEKVARAREEAIIQELIKAAEENAVLSSEVSAKAFKAESKKSHPTIKLVRRVDFPISSIEHQAHALEKSLSTYQHLKAPNLEDEGINIAHAEERLSLKILKDDFSKMKIIGQFNLGFILASRVGRPDVDHTEQSNDDLFIIDQHASDEKFNFERLQATTIVQSQRLVHPKTLDLTAVEEEVLKENLSALETNGFVIKIDESGERPVGQRCQLLSLPLSRETAFSISDLEELLALLSENPSGSVPRPSRVRKMFAMRACRSSIMIGRTLTHRQMANVVKHMGEIDKPWNCPHGRPTMRHLCGLGGWDEVGWKEGDTPDGRHGGVTNWSGYARQKRADSKS